MQNIKNDFWGEEELERSSWRFINLYLLFRYKLVVLFWRIFQIVSLVLCYFLYYKRLLFKIEKWLFYPTLTLILIGFEYMNQILLNNYLLLKASSFWCLKFLYFYLICFKWTNKPAFTRNIRGMTLVHLVYWNNNKVFYKRLFKVEKCLEEKF